MSGMRRATRICVTLGPASADPAAIEGLARAGAEIFRLNFSHGDHAFHGRLIDGVRAAAAATGRPLALLQDLQGPKIRVGELEGGGPVELAAGAEVELTEAAVLGTAALLPVRLPGLARQLQPGHRVLLADGTLALEVLEIRGERVRCRVVLGGALLPHKGVNLPQTSLAMGCLMEKDLEDLAFGLGRGVDMVALSFVRRAADIAELRTRIREAGSTAWVVAKIERPEALRESDAILAASDAAIVARGDLGVELGVEKVPLVQKQLITRCRELGVPVITATEMLESMKEAHRPTRAEASDVANAIEDGTSALMLSAETAMGRHPALVVETMDRIARYAELTLAMPAVDPLGRPGAPGEVAEAVVHAACRAARDLKARALVVFTRSGATARKVARYRLRIPVHAFTPDEEVRRRLGLCWGVEAHLSRPRARHPGDLYLDAVETLAAAGAVAPGERLVMVAGHMEVQGTTHTMRVWTVGADEGRS